MSVAEFLKSRDPEKPQPVLTTVGGAATILAVSQSAIWKMLREGRLESVKVGGSRRIRIADLHRLAEGPTNE